MRKWRGLPISIDLYSKVVDPVFRATHRERGKVFVQRWEVTTQEMVGMIFKVYTGKRWFFKFVTNDDVGYKFGEFVDTRVPFIHLRRRKMKKRGRQRKKNG